MSSIASCQAEATASTLFPLRGERAESISGAQKRRIDSINSRSTPDRDDNDLAVALQKNRVRREHSEKEAEMVKTSKKA